MEPCHTTSDHRETAHASLPTSMPPESTAHPLAFYSDLHTEPCRRDGPPEHRPSHWFR